MTNAWDEDARRLADTLERRLPGALRRPRLQALQAIARLEERIRRDFARAAKKLRPRLERASGAQARAIIQRELARVVRRVMRRLARSLADTSRAGLALHVAEVATTLGTDAPVMKAILDRWTSPARDVLLGRVAKAVPIRLQLSQVASQTAEALAAEVAAGRAAGESAIEVAKRLRRMAGAELRQAVPQFVQELEAIARSTPPGSARREAIARFRSQVLARDSVAGTPFSIRGATRKLLSELEEADGVDIDAAVEQWVERKATYRARVIARTENNRAFSQSYLRAARNNPAVRAIKWNLSASHPRPDICDLFAAEDPDGLGIRGAYLPGNEPNAPAHANCLCFFTSVLVPPDGSDPIPGGPARGPVETLESMSERERVSILGPGRAREFARASRQERARFFNSDGTFKPLREVARERRKRRG